LIVVVVVARFGYTPFLEATANYLIENDGPRKAEAIVVLGGDSYGDRTLKGAELAKEGYAHFVLVSGPPRLMGYSSADQIQFAEQRGYPASLFREEHLPADAESTRTEVRVLGKYLQEQGIHNVLLVTSNFHTKRAARIWRTENPGINVAVVPSVDPDRIFTPETWWKSRPGQKIFIYEWMKTISVMLGV